VHTYRGDGNAASVTRQRWNHAATCLNQRCNWAAARLVRANRDRAAMENAGIFRHLPRGMTMFVTPAYAQASRSA